MQSKSYYEIYLHFATPEKAEFVAQIAEKYGVDFDVDGCDMYFHDKDSFDYLDYHYVMKMDKRDVKKKSNIIEVKIDE